MVGNRARRRASKPGSRRSAFSSPWQVTIASMAGVAAPEIGPAQGADAGDFHGLVSPAARARLEVFIRRVVVGAKAGSATAAATRARPAGRLRRPRRRRRSGSAECPGPRPAATAASRLSRLTPAWVARQMVRRPRPGRKDSLLPLASTTRSCRTSTALPPAAWCAASASACGSARRGSRRRRTAAARPATRGSAALSTAAPSGSTTSTWVRSTLTIWSLVGDVELGQAVGAVEVGHDADLRSGRRPGRRRRIVAAPFSITTACTARFISRRWPASQLALSRASTRRRSRNRPSRQARPVWRPPRPHQPGRPGARARPCAARAGHADHRDAAGRRRVGEQVVEIARPTGRGEPTAGFRCISRPGPALTSTIAPPCCVQRPRDVLGHQVDAGDVQADHARGQRGRVRDLGWTWSVQSMATLPLRWISTRWPAAGTTSASSSWRLSSSRSSASVATSMHVRAGILRRRRGADRC